MYVTRPLSMYRKFPASLDSAPLEGPNSGVLVILDEEAEPTCCFGKCKWDELPALPFPQNKSLKTRYYVYTGQGFFILQDKVILIPVLNKPLSSNLYYAIQPCGSHQGEAFVSSTEEDKTRCGFLSFKRDKKPQPFDSNNLYQQFQISPKCGGFSAKSVIEDAYPPRFLRRRDWKLARKSSTNLDLRPAPGLDSKLRSSLPELNSSPVVVGRWYVPFIFVKEGSVKEQMNRSMYYEMVLEQRWERIYGCDNDKSGGDVVVDVFVDTEVVLLHGEVVDGVVWFRSGGREVGLSVEVVERMYWEEERFGWVRGEKRQVKVKRVERCEKFEWRRFDCYVLVERFVLKRMDGSLVFSCDFMHIDRVRSKWE